MLKHNRRPAERSQSPLMPLALLAVGIGAAIYGAVGHRIPVAEKRREEFPVAVPVERPTPPGMGNARRRVPPPRRSAPPEKFVKRIRTTEMILSGLEPAINGAVEVGRITRTKTGKLVQTPAAATGPAFCPT